MDCHIISVIVNNSHSWESTLLAESSPREPCDLAARTPGQNGSGAPRESVTLNPTKQLRSTALKIISVGGSQALGHNYQNVGLPLK